MQEIHSSNPPVLTEIFDPNKYGARYQHSLKLESKLKYLKKIQTFYTDHLLLTPAFNKRPGVYLRIEGLP